MLRNLDVASPSGVVFGWLSAAVGFASAVAVAVVGQGAGAVTGGCGWIGVSLPIDRQAWALVNQPALNFASQPRAFGYWLGSLVLPLLVAAAVVHLIPRARSLSSELLAVHVAWGMIVVGVAWLPLLDPVDGHIARFLKIHGVPLQGVWLAPTLAAGVAFLPTLRLLALARITRQHIGRGARLGLILLHLGVPCVAWAALVSTIHGTPMVIPSVAIAAPLVVACTIARFGYPPPYAHQLRELDAANWLRVLITAAVVITLLWLTGRPLGDGRYAGVAWGAPGAYNNVRPWVETAPAWPRR